MKYCPRCQQTKPVSEFNRSTRYGYQGYCRPCIRQYRLDNPLRYIAKQHRYRKKHPDADINYYLAHREQILARMKEQYYANHEAKLAYYRAYRAKNAKRIAEYQKEYRRRLQP